MAGRQDVWETFPLAVLFLISAGNCVRAVWMVVVHSLYPNSGNRVVVTPNAEQRLLTP